MDLVTDKIIRPRPSTGKKFFPQTTPKSNKTKTSLRPSSSKLNSDKSSATKIQSIIREEKKVETFSGILKRNASASGGARRFMNFRQIGPSLKYNHKVFNKYWMPDEVYNKIRKNPEENNVSLHTAEIIKVAENEVKKLNLENIDLENELFKMDDFDSAAKYKGGNYSTYNDRETLPKISKMNTQTEQPKEAISFIARVGGKDLDLSRCLTTMSTRPQSEMHSTFSDKAKSRNSKVTTRQMQNRPFTAIGINRLKEIKERIVSGKPPVRPTTAIYKAEESIQSFYKRNRPTTALQRGEDSAPKSIVPSRVQTALDEKIKEEYEYNVSFFEEEDEPFEEYKKKEREYMKKLSNYPNVESLLKNYEKVDFIKDSIKKNMANRGLLDLIDRSQSTRTATLDKVGSNTYRSPYQRIASFMNFSQHLRLEDLQKVYTFIYLNRKNSTGYSSKHNVQKPNFGELLVNYCLHFKDACSLFHGFMPFEEEGMKLISPVYKRLNTYDPLDFLRKYVDESQFNENMIPPDVKKLILDSTKNYEMYIKSGKISSNDIKPFNESSLRRKILRKLPISVANYLTRDSVRQFMHEIHIDYDRVLKSIVLNYILRSPFERQRLNIMYRPNTVLPASYTIAQHGSFNNKTYKDWIANYNSAFLFLNSNLQVANIAISALNSWTYSFRHVNLLYLTQIDSMKEPGIKAIHVDEFYRIQDSYVNKVFHFLRDVYYRGCILITQKNKELKRNDIQYDGKWTFLGFIPKNEDNEEKFLDDNYGMKYDEQLLDFWTNVNFADLNDVRLTPSNIGYMTYIKRKKINLDVPEYEQMSVEAKIKFNNCITVFCSNFFRQLAEKALNEFADFFEKYEENDSIFKRLLEKGEKSYLDGFEYKPKALKLPFIKPFVLSSEVEPLISIKTKYEEIYGVVKLEFTFEQVFEKVANIVNTICEIFERLVTTHFLQFKKIKPSDRETTMKDHSTKLNEFFKSDKKQNKSFLEEYYLHLCPNLIIEEMNTNKFSKKHLSVIKVNERFVSDIKSRIYRKMKTQYIDLDECLKIFEPLKELYTNTFDETINSFTKNFTRILDYLNILAYLEKIRTFMDYVVLIPDRIKYSMFVIDTRETKAMLQEKINRNLRKIFNAIEGVAMNLYEHNCEKYTEITRLTDVKLTTPQEVVDMDKIKHKTSQDLIIVKNDFDDAQKIFSFLLKENEIFPDDLQTNVCVTIMKHLKFEESQKRIEEMHQANREAIEEKFKKDREQLEEEKNSYLEELKLMDKQTYINEYEKVLLNLKDLQGQSDNLEQKILNSLKDEELLFDYKNDAFEEFFEGKKKLEKLKILWENIKVFYDNRKELVHNFSEQSDLEHYIEIFDDIEGKVKDNHRFTTRKEAIIDKLSKIVEDDIENMSMFLTIIQKVFDSPIPLSEELKQEVMVEIENKKLEQSFREILFMYFTKKGG